MQRIDPWGSIDIKNYEKLSKEFGIQPFKKILSKVSNPSMYMGRNIIYGHKDFEIILNAINKKQKFAMLTGLMPSGKFHLGHKVITDQIVYYQSLGAQCYITVADIESYLTRNVSLEDAYKIAINDYLLNYIALGLKPHNVHFYFQSRGSKEYMNLSKYVSKKTTFNEVKAIYGEISPAKLISALTQVADILYPQLNENNGPKPVIVPVGFDQLPHINFTRDIALRMKQEYNFILPSATFNKFMPSLQGDAKMSSSKPESYIALTDDEKTVSNKIMKYAYSGGQATIEEHRKKGGNPGIDISYQWLTFLEENDKKLEKIYYNYKSGKLLTSELKQILIEKLNSFLKKHKQNREKAKKIVHKFLRD